MCYYYNYCEKLSIQIEFVNVVYVLVGLDSFLVMEWFIIGNVQGLDSFYNVLQLSNLVIMNLICDKIVDEYNVFMLILRGLWLFRLIFVVLDNF